MKKIDVRKELKYLYNPSATEVTIVDVPEMSFLMIDGHGDPNTAQEYAEAIEALYALSYTLKFTIKKEEEIDYGVMPLEGLWWVEDMARFSVDKKEEWDWTSMIMQPEYVTDKLFGEAVIQTKKKNPPALSKIRFESYKEGLAVQIMHIGPFSEEGPAVERVHDFTINNGYEIIGKHHEIYLSDPRKSAPEKMRTVIRQPIKKVS